MYRRPADVVLACLYEGQVKAAVLGPDALEVVVPAAVAAFKDFIFTIGELFGIRAVKGHTQRL